VATLYLVSTPIGNLGDLSARCAETLRSVDRILAEDTRRTRILADRVESKAPLVSLHEHNERARLPRLLEALEAGQTVALASDAGTPLLSDPGFLLVREAAARGVTVEAVPGPSAALAALVVSGLPPHPFTFAGFPPPKRGKRRRFYARFAQLVDAGVAPLAAGGDHSITHPIFRALGADAPVGRIHIDAHTDTWGPLRGSKFHHGSPFRLATDEGLLDPTRTIQIGIRGAQNWADGWDYSRDKGMRVVFIEEFVELGVDAVIAEARKVVGDGPTYISFDVDGLDPVYAPGTGTPEVGGITTREANQLLRGFRGLNLIGGDVVEVAPPFDPSGNTALVGATLMYEILCLLAE